MYWKDPGQGLVASRQVGQVGIVGEGGNEERADAAAVRVPSLATGEAVGDMGTFENPFEKITNAARTKQERAT